MAAILIIGGVAMAKGKPVDAADLPRQAQLFIEKNYGKNVVHHASVERHTFGSDEYDVVLKDGTEMEFDGNGALKDIESGMKGVPESIVPPSVLNYVKRYFPGQKIQSLEFKSNGYEADLGNGVELEFDSRGQFKKIDR